jgi:hypothetical protein
VSNPEIDWSYIGERAFLAFIGVCTAWNTWAGNKRSRQLSEIHALSNSAMGAIKKSLAQVTAAKAVLTNDWGDKKIADDAMQDYLEHESRQHKADRM